MRLLRAPVTWVVGILVTVAAVTFQDVLSATLRTVLPLDRVSDQVAPGDAIDVVSVRSVRAYGTWLVRAPGRPGSDTILKTLSSPKGWDGKLNSVDVGEAQWLITLEGRGGQQVRITDIVPEIEGGACAKPLDGSVIRESSQGGEEVIALHSAIDSTDTRLRRYTSNRAAKEPFFTGREAKHITLKRNESIGLMMYASAKQGYCRWRYRVHFDIAGSSKTMVISAPGNAPFQLTAPLPDLARYDDAYLSPIDACARKWKHVTGGTYARIRNDPDFYADFCDWGR